MAPDNVAVGDVVQSGGSVPVTTGNSRPLGTLPTGTLVHNIESTPGNGGQIAKSAGAAVSYTHLRAHET